MDNPDDDTRVSSSRRLVVSKENFDDYLLALMAKLRRDPDADRLLSGETQHPLVLCQQQNRQVLIALAMPFFPLQDLIDDPVATYVEFQRLIDAALQNAAAPVPVPGDLNILQDLQTTHRAAERYIYTTIVSTLEVGLSMHYAR